MRALAGTQDAFLLVTAFSHSLDPNRPFAQKCTEVCFGGFTGPTYTLVTAPIPRRPFYWPQDPRGAPESADEPQTIQCLGGSSSQILYAARESVAAANIWRRRCFSSGGEKSRNSSRSEIQEGQAHSVLPYGPQKGVPSDGTRPHAFDRLVCHADRSPRATCRRAAQQLITSWRPQRTSSR